MLFPRYFYSSIIFVNLFVWTILPGHAQVVLSEIMYDPATSEAHDEYIEVYNLSESLTVDLKGWMVGDGLEQDMIVDAGNGTILEAGQYAVILDGSYFGNSTTYNYKIPATALIVKIDDAAFGSGGISNSNVETVVVINNSNDTVSVVKNNCNNLPGFSNEKIDILAGDFPENWTTSIILGGTPGYKNSVSPFEYDLSVYTISFSPQKVRRNDSVTIITTVKNIGKQAIDSWNISLYHDKNNDSLVQHSEVLEVTAATSTMLLPGDSVTTPYNWHNAPAGVQSIIAKVEAAMDENLVNNQKMKQLAVGYWRSDVLINEVMYRPGAGEPEWIELYNSSADSVDLKMWSLSDSHEERKIRLIDKTIIMKSNKYAIIAEDSLILHLFPGIDGTVLTPDQGWPALNNSGDAVILRDAAGFVIDSLYYFPQWGGEASISLERIRLDRPTNLESNWDSCLDKMGGTPNGRNSISPKEYDVGIKEKSLYCEPAVPSYNELISIFVVICNAGMRTASTLKVYFFWDQNMDSLFAASEQLSNAIEFDSLNVGEEITVGIKWLQPPSGVLSLGVYIDCEIDQNRENNLSIIEVQVGYPHRSIVINEIMYSPDQGCSEWIEIFNRSTQHINLDKWYFSDSNAERRQLMANDPLVMPPNSFAVLAQDSMDPILYNQQQCPVLICNAWPILNSDKDEVILYDLNGTVIDSVAYFYTWGGGAGISLERINPNLASQISTNWSSCVDQQGGTPGRMNSLYVIAVPTRTTLTVIPNPFSPDGDGFEDVATIQYQLPLTTATIHLKIYDATGRLIRFLRNNHPSGSIGSMLWDGCDDNGLRARIGIYIIYLEAINALKGKLEKARTTVVLAGRH